MISYKLKKIYLFSIAFILSATTFGAFASTIQVKNTCDSRNIVVKPNGWARNTVGCTNDQTQWIEKDKSYNFTVTQKGTEDRCIYKITTSGGYPVVFSPKEEFSYVVCSKDWIGLCACKKQ